jgi:hypothetical protein
MTAFPYDFSGLHRPMSRQESRARRRSILAGKSLFSALEIEHWAGLIVVGGINLFMVIPVAVIVAIGGILAVPFVQNVGDVLALVLLVVVVPLAAAAIVFFSMRALLIPPRWRAWVRMQRFAEENGLEFVREQIGADVPSALIPKRHSMLPPRIYGAFRDAARGILVGDYVLPAAAPDGMGSWRGIVEVTFEGRMFDEDGGFLSYAAIQRVLGDTPGNWSIEVELVGDRAIAMRSIPFGTRNAEHLERAFRMAWALHENLPAFVGSGEGRPG